MAFVISGGHLVKYQPEEGETAVVIPEGVEYIDTYALSGTIDKECKKIERAQFPDSIKKFTWHVLEYCTNLKEVILPANLQEIVPYFFYECRALKQIQFPETVKTIGQEAFTHCESLKEIDFPVNLHLIDREAFQYCRNLQRVRFSENLRTIGKNAFFYCQNLNFVEFPEQRLCLGDWSFCCCSLKEVTFSLPLQMGAFAFDKDVILHIRTDKGMLTMQFADWKNNQDEKFFIQFLESPSEERFQNLRKIRYRILLALYMMQYYPEQEFYQKYIKRNVKKTAKMLIDSQDSENIRLLMNAGCMTKKNIDELIAYALEQKQHEIQVLLMDWKYQNTETESIEKQVQKKFRL